MVLWEITLGTAYFLGLKRTYRLALKIQRRSVGPKSPKISQFLHRRTRTVFNMALDVHKNIQQRDLEVGRNLGNWILRWLDRIKPSAQIYGTPEKPPQSTNSTMDMAKKPSSSSHLRTPGNMQTPRNLESDRHLFTPSRNIWSKFLPVVSVMIRPPRPAGTMTQHRHFCISGVDFSKRGCMEGGLDGVFIRKDVMLWMLQK